MSDNTYQALVRRLVSACVGHYRPLVYREACQVVTWAARALDWRVIDEEIGRALVANKRPVLPRALVPAIQARASRHGILLEVFG